MLCNLCAVLCYESRRQVGCIHDIIRCYVVITRWPDDGELFDDDCFSVGRRLCKHKRILRARKRSNSNVLVTLLLALPEIPPEMRSVTGIRWWNIYFYVRRRSWTDFLCVLDLALSACIGDHCVSVKRKTCSALSMPFYSVRFLNQDSPCLYLIFSRDCFSLQQDNIHRVHKYKYLRVRSTC